MYLYFAYSHKVGWHSVTKSPYIEDLSTTANTPSMVHSCIYLLQCVGDTLTLLNQRQRTWGGRGGLSPPLFEQGGAEPPPKLEMSMVKCKYYVIANRLCRMYSGRMCVNYLLYEHRAPPLLTCRLCPCECIK